MGNIKQATSLALIGALAVTAVVGYTTGRKSAQSLDPTDGSAQLQSETLASTGALFQSRLPLVIKPESRANAQQAGSEDPNSATVVVDHSFVLLSPAELVDISDVVITGTVQAVGSPRFNTPSGVSPAGPYDIDNSAWLLHSMAVVSVTHVYKGNPLLTHFVLAQRGGTAASASGGMIQESAPNTTKFVEGQQLMLFIANPLGDMLSNPVPWVARAEALRADLNTGISVAGFGILHSGFVYDTAGNAFSAEDRTTINIAQLQAVVAAAVLP